MGSVPSDMGRRGSNRELLAITREPHWLAVYGPAMRQPLESTAIPVGTDLRDVMHDAIARRLAMGWTVECDGAYGLFFCNRGTARLEVRIQSVDPNQPVPLDDTSPFRPRGSE
jgi:hypothetical protein